MRAAEKKWPMSRRETRQQYIARLFKTAKSLPKKFIEDSIADMVRRCQRLYVKKGRHFEEGGRGK